MTKPKILLTNDDGIFAPGLLHLADAVKEFADITIVAPAQEKSGSSMGVSFLHPIEVIDTPTIGGHRAWQVTGTPADCVKVGMMMFMDSPPDFIISGINRGSNVGRAVLYSGTLGGAIEGAYKGIAGIGFSSSDERDPKYEAFIPYIRPIVEYFMDDPLPPGTVLNVNFPAIAPPHGIKMARQGIGAWLDSYEEISQSEGQKKYLLKGKWEENGWHEESDYYLVQQGYITAVPIHVHELTCYRTLENKKENFESSLRKILY